MTDLHATVGPVTESVTSPTDRPNRVLDTVTHASSLILAVALALAIGRPLGWIGFVLPLAPTAIVAVTIVVGRTTPRGWRSLLAFDLLCALLIGGGWLGTQAGRWWVPLAYLFPLALLAFTLGLVNYPLVTISRTHRAVRGHRFDYPWIPTRLAAAFGIDERAGE